MSEIINTAFENLDPESEKRVGAFLQEVEEYWEQRKEAFEKVGWGKDVAKDFWEGLVQPSFNYEVSLRATLTREEADLAYKYLKAHPDTERYTTQGEFGFAFVNYFKGVDVHRDFTSREIDKMLKAMEWPFAEQTVPVQSLNKKLTDWFQRIQKESLRLLKEQENEFNLECYLETHYQMVAAIERELNRYCEGSVVWQRLDTNGTGGLWMLAKEWADDFEQRHVGREWDGDWIDAIEEFLDEKMKV